VRLDDLPVFNKHIHGVTRRCLGYSDILWEGAPVGIGRGTMSGCHTDMDGSSNPVCYGLGPGVFGKN